MLAELASLSLSESILFALVDQLRIEEWSARVCLRYASAMSAVRVWRVCLSADSRTIGPEDH